MKNLITVLVLSLVVISIISCKSALLRVVGFRVPKIESQKSIEKFLRHSGQPIENAYSMDTALYEHLRTIPFKPGWPADFRPIQIRVYNSEGKPIMHWVSCEGFLKDLHTFDTVPPRNQVNLDSTLNLQADLDRYFTLDGHPAHILAEPGYDYYFVVYYGLFFPRISRQNFKAIEAYKKEHPELKIKTYLIDVDAQDWWNTEIISDLSIGIGGKKK